MNDKYLKYKQQYKEYYIKNKDKIKQQRAKHYHKNKEKILATHKLYNNKHQEERRLWKQQFLEKHPNYEKERWLKNKYGMTLQEMNQLLEKQNNVCAICQKPFIIESKLKKDEMQIDHCHQTGKIRGIVHYHCNLTIGNAKEDIELLKKCIEYLEKHKIYG